MDVCTPGMMGKMSEARILALIHADTIIIDEVSMVRADLLDAIEAHQLDPRERQWLTSVRNAFCHNSYYKIDMQQIEKKLPTIIQQIVEIVQRITDKASHPSNQ